MTTQPVEAAQGAAVDANFKLLQSLVDKVSLCLDVSDDVALQEVGPSRDIKEHQARPGLRVQGAIDDPKAFFLPAELRNGPINAFTRFLPERAGADICAAAAVNADGGAPYDLYGVPYGVKALFDVQGYTTTAGAKMRLGYPVATGDAKVISRLRAAGAVLVGTTNMDEYAYGFSTNNHHFGVTRNPHDLDRIVGGSSGGSAAAVAAGLVPFALGTDTNGSIRIPAALCGIYGLRATHGSVPVDGAFPFVDELDVVGPLAASLNILRNVYNCISGATLRGQRLGRIRIATLDSLFAQATDLDFVAALQEIKERVSDCSSIKIPLIEEARAAAFVLTAIKGSFLHRNTLEKYPMDLDPNVRDRLIAGKQLSAHCLLQVESFKSKFKALADTIWQHADVLIAPSAPCVAPLLRQENIIVQGISVPVRSHLGIFTQPFSLLGCPVLASPLYRPGRLPLGLQLIAAPGREQDIFDVAEQLEALGITGVHSPQV